MFRIAGPDMEITQAIQNSALHDLQAFVVEYIADWGFNDDGEIVLKVHWRGFDESEETWEPLAQLYDDVQDIVVRYVAAADNQDLAAELTQVRQAAATRRRAASANPASSANASDDAARALDPIRQVEANNAAAASATNTAGTAPTQESARAQRYRRRQQNRD